MADLTVIILTRNEQDNIKDCIQSVIEIAKRIIVMDSFSTDDTVKNAAELGADVYQHEFKHYGAQFQYALDTCSINTTWVFRLDADERLTDEGRREIEYLCNLHANSNINGFVFRLQNYFLNKKIKHGVLNTLEKLCIFKFGKAHMENRYMGEHILLDEGEYIYLESMAEHFGVKSVTSMVNKLNWYAQREAKDYFIQLDNTTSEAILDKAAKKRRYLKYSIYYKLPGRLRCFAAFFYWFFIKGGFLDGREGFYWNFFQVYYYRNLVDAIIYEANINGSIIKETGAL